MSHPAQQEAEELTRQEAAERLTDIAYALTAGGPLKLGANQEVTVPVSDRMSLKLVCKSNGDRVELELELTWSTASA